ncbi:FxDxF family PEP-CTERM protein [Pseudoduganella rhizocola]|uniref:FxDxF family PEP-CTERM protein n=1 Tax=Pseudoduganella rhizocola TaxID=3382643 RepID=UPI0038B4CF58
MKKLKTALAAIAIAGTAWSAQAADISTTGSIALTSGTNYFGRVLDGAAGDTFTDRWDFASIGTFDLAAGVIAITPGTTDGISIDHFELFNSAGLSLGGTSLSSGMTDVWTLSTTHLVPDSYYLQVSGTLLGDDAASYGGTLTTVTAVPEPETYGMLIGGLGLLGFLARRRKQA